MTEDKARKRATRIRMARTGERYTAARRHIVKDKSQTLPPRVADPGTSDEKIKHAIGRDWDEWLKVLDRWGATSRSHTEIARYVNEEFGVDGWWSQTVTVGYERARGMRAKYQRPDGFFSVTISKTLPVDVDRVFVAFTEASERRRWLEPGTLKVRMTQPGKTARFDFPADGSRVHVYFTPKGREKTTVAVACERLPDPESVEERREFWKERLGWLAKVLT
jgi:hypothetical protein